MQLDLATRHRICFLFEQGLSIRQIANRLHTTRKAVSLWVKRGRGEQGLQNAKGSGRKKSMDNTAASRAVDLLLADGSNTCTQVAKQLHEEGLTTRPVHRTTVSRHAKATAAAEGRPIKASRGKPSKQLTVTTKALRLKFCDNNKRRSWAHVMFTDRKKFLFKYPGASVKRVQWLEKGKTRVAPTVNHPMCVNMYCGITVFGPTKPRLVAGTSKLSTNFKNKKGEKAKNITASEYEDVCMADLLPEGQRIFSTQGISTWVFQQDNDPSHKGAGPRAIKLFNEKRNSSVQLLPDWPGNSPDLNPIENAWAHVQSKVDAAGCKNFEEFKETVVREWCNLSAEYCANLIGSMPGRLTTCIGLEGEKTGY